MERMRVITLFSGYDSQCLAMERIKNDFPQFDYDLVAWCEIEKYACVAHDALFPQWKERNIGDITKVDAQSIPNCDLITWSFPCTDISNAGKQQGLSEDSGTRSSLCWDAIRIFKAKKPKYLLMENVKALVSDKFKADFRMIIDALEDIGYKNFWKVLDARQFGVPQHRERVFMVSILDCDSVYYFPKPFKLEKRLKDVLEENVDESYYLKQEQVERIVEHTERKVQEGCGFRVQFKEKESVSGTITGQYGQRETDTYLKEEKVIKVGNYHKSGHNASAVLDNRGIAPTVMENHGTVNAVVEPKVINPLKGVTDKSWFFEQQVYDENGIARAIKSTDGSGNVPKIIQRGRGFNKGGVLDECPTISSNSWEHNNVVACASRTRGDEHNIEFRGDVANAVTTINTDSMVGVSANANYRIRKLTPRECFRLMDVSDEDIDKIQTAGISKSSQYRLAGNSIVVSCLYHIFRKLFIDTQADSGQQLQLF